MRTCFILEFEEIRIDFTRNFILFELSYNNQCAYKKCHTCFLRFLLMIQLLSDNGNHTTVIPIISRTYLVDLSII